VDRQIADAEENYFAAWRLLAGYARGGQVEESDDVLFTSIPAPVAYFNSAFVKSPSKVATCAADIRAYFAAKRVPFTIRFRDDEEASAMCEALGMHAADASPVMWREASGMDASNLDVRVVDDASLPDYVATMAHGFGMPTDLCEQVLTAASVSDPNYAMVLAYDDDLPVGTAAVVVSGHVAGVYNVSTPPDLRKRGFAEAATRFAVAEGLRRGCSHTTLQSSAMGFSLYERMGYRTLVSWKSYTSEPA
jgi:hypothetical protein